MDGVASGGLPPRRSRKPPLNKNILGDRVDTTTSLGHSRPARGAATKTKKAALSAVATKNGAANDNGVTSTTKRRRRRAAPGGGGGGKVSCGGGDKKGRGGGATVANGGSGNKRRRSPATTTAASATSSDGSSSPGGGTENEKKTLIQPAKKKRRLSVEREVLMTQTAAAGESGLGYNDADGWHFLSPGTNSEEDDDAMNGRESGAELQPRSSVLSSSTSAPVVARAPEEDNKTQRIVDNFCSLVDELRRPRQWDTRCNDSDRASLPQDETSGSESASSSSSEAGTHSGSSSRRRRRQASPPPPPPEEEQDAGSESDPLIELRYGSGNREFVPDALGILAVLTCPARYTHVMERWAPVEVAYFEAALRHHGKDFNAVQRHLPGKSTKDVIEMFYCWKKSSAGVRWREQCKAAAAAEEEEEEEEEGEEEEEKKTKKRRKKEETENR